MSGKRIKIELVKNSSLVYSACWSPLARQSERACPSSSLGLSLSLTERPQFKVQIQPCLVQIYHFLNLRIFLSNLKREEFVWRLASYQAVAVRQECLNSRMAANQTNSSRLDEPSKLEFLRSEIHFRCSRRLPSTGRPVLLVAMSIKFTQRGGGLQMPCILA